MEKVLGKYSEQSYALLRIVAGFLFLCHGAQKILGLLGGRDGEGATVELLSRAGVAGIIEFTPALNRDKRVSVWIALPITFTVR